MTRPDLARRASYIAACRALGFAPPAGWKLTPLEASFLSELLVRETVTPAQMMSAIYGNPPSGGPEPGSIQPADNEPLIVTIHGKGWRMTPEAKAWLRAQGPQLAEAA